MPTNRPEKSTTQTAQPQKSGIEKSAEKTPSASSEKGTDKTTPVVQKSAPTITEKQTDKAGTAPPAPTSKPGSHTEKSNTPISKPISQPAKTDSRTDTVTRPEESSDTVSKYYRFIITG